MLGLDDRELESVDRERESVDMLKMDVSDRERESVEDVTLDGGGDSDGDVAFFVGLLPCCRPLALCRGPFAFVRLF